MGFLLPKLLRSEDCFQIGWPMRLEHDFFWTQHSSNRKASKRKQSVKTDEDRKNANEDEEMGVCYATH